MLGLYRSGRRAEALRAYRRAETELDSELGVRPGAALERLREDITRQSPDLDFAPVRVEIAPVNPATAARPGVVGQAHDHGRLLPSVPMARPSTGVRMRQTSLSDPEHSTVCSAGRTSP